MLFALFGRYPLAGVLIGAAVMTDILIGATIISSLNGGNGIFPKGLRFGFYKVDEKKEG